MLIADLPIQQFLSFLPAHQKNGGDFMPDAKLNGLKVAILATNGFEESELLKPKQALEEAGAKISIISPESGEIYGMKHHEKAGKVKVDLTLADAAPEDFDAVLLPGGGLNADTLR